MRKLRHIFVNLIAKIINHKLDVNHCINYQQRLNDYYSRINVPMSIEVEEKLHEEFSDLCNEFANMCCVEKCHLDSWWNALGKYQINPELLKGN